MSEKYPILAILLPFAGGILFNNAYATIIPLLLVSFLLALFLLTAFIMSEKSGILKVILIIISFYAGFSAFALQEKKAERMDLRKDFPVAVEAVAKGYVASIPEKKTDRTIFLLQSEKIRIGDGYYALPGNIRVSIGDNIDGIRYGSSVTVSGKASAVRSFRNFSSFDYSSYLRQEGICLNLYVPSGLFVRKESGDKASFTSFAYFVREKMIHNINENLPKPYSDLCAGILVGARDFIPENIRNDFIRSGTYHLFAISGFHIGIVSASVYFFLSLLGLGRKKRALLSSLIVVFYAFVAGMGDSVTRAMIMALCFFASIIFERENNPNNALFAALMIVLVINPQGLFSAGVLLTFLAAFSIINCSRPIYEKLSFVPFKYFRGLLAAALSAQLGIIPVLAYFFNYLSPAGIVSNILCVPVASVAFIWGAVSTLVSFVWHNFGEVFFLAEEAILYTLFELVKFFSNVPYSYVSVVTPGFFEILFYYLFAASLFFPFLKSVKKSVIPVSLFFLLSLTIAGNWGFFSTPLLRATFLDVGESESAVFETPQGKVFLVDTGGTYDNSFDTGGKIVVPALLKNGIKKIDAVFLTHPHPDHINGIISIMKNMEVKEIFIGGCFYGKDYPVIRKMQKEAKSRGVKIGRIKEGWEKNYDGVEVKVLYPGESDCFQEKNINNLSLVMTVSYAGKRILMTGDIEKNAIEKIMEKGPDILCDVIKVPHHGGRTSAIREFYELTGCKRAVISAGYENRFKHPSKEILEIIGNLGITLFRTDLNGAVRVELSEDDIRFQTAETSLK